MAQGDQGRVVPDPAGVDDPAGLAVALAALQSRTGLSLRDLERAAALLPPVRGRRRTLPRATVSQMCRNGRPPRETLETFLLVCQVDDADRAQWFAAWERAHAAGLSRPGGAVRVEAADPYVLGVHRAITLEDAEADAVPPGYVTRDVDAGTGGLRARLRTAATRGGFVLLVGGSSVGKTRTAYEAVCGELAGWWLVHPTGPAAVAALSADPPARTVVWLDEMQRFLDDERGLDAGSVRALLTCPAPIILIGTMWPDRYSAYTAPPATGERDDPHARERAVLGLADVVRVAPVFGQAERARAEAVAPHDPRMRVALDTVGYGLTQTLAAAPQLVGRWQDAETDAPYAWAVMTAALDAARFGARAPMTADLLRAAAIGYCSDDQRAEAPIDWFEQALAYATRQLHGAARPLLPVAAPGGMGTVAGYTVADYLLHHVGRIRHGTWAPASLWDAVTSHTGAVDDLERLAANAQDRLLYGHAVRLLRRVDGGPSARTLAALLADCGDLDESHAHAAAGDFFAEVPLTRLLVDCCDVEGLQNRVDLGDGWAGFLLADLYANRGGLGWLKSRAAAGDERAAARLAALLDHRNDLRALRARADAGDKHAAARLTALLTARGDVHGAAVLLRARVDLGDEEAHDQLVDLLADRGDLEGLRARAAGGDVKASDRLAKLLAARGDLDGLRTQADAGVASAEFHLVELLADRTDLDGLRARADRGGWWSACRLVEVLAHRGELGELRVRADAGDERAAARLAGLALHQRDIDDLRARAYAGDEKAGDLLIDVLADRGDFQALRAYHDMGATWVGRRTANLLVNRGELGELRALADNGDRSAGQRLAEVLAHHGDADGLRALADRGNRDASRHLIELLADRGDLDGLRAVADGGDRSATDRLAQLLTARGDLVETIDLLRSLPYAVGNEAASQQLAQLLAARGDLDGLRAQDGRDDGYASHLLAELLADRGDLDGLRVRAEAGDRAAQHRLASVLAACGDVNRMWDLVPSGTLGARLLIGALAVAGQKEEAEQLRRCGLNPYGSIAGSPIR